MYCPVSLLVLISLNCFTRFTVDAMFPPTSFSHKQNVALHRTTAQSSTFNRYISKLAVDGDTNTNIDGGLGCTQTGNDGRSSWSVFLDPQTEYNITNVTLYLRDALANRYKDLQVFVDGDLCGRGNIANTNSEAAPIPNPVFLRCDRPLPGHNVTVQVNNSYLTLCEIQIWVCEDGWYGEDCNKECRCRNTSEVCDKLTGYCRSGCAGGWEGRGCQTGCTEGTYGRDCSQTCGNCSGDAVCEPTSGVCHDGCQQGYSPPLCQTKCSNRAYGFNCSQDSMKLPACTDGMYGRDCDQTCGNCSGDAVCLPTSGVCPDGCQLGYSPPLCQTRKTLSHVFILSQPMSEVALRTPDNETYIPAVGAVCGVVLMLIVTLGIVFFLRRRKNSPKEESTRHWDINIQRDADTGQQSLDVEARVDFKTASGNNYENVTLYCNCVPMNIAIDELQEYIKKKINKGEFEAEFKALQYGIAGAHEAGKKPENKKRNRFIGLFPYDNTRVILEPDGASTWDYINASFVPGYGDKKTFIAAQGPIAKTVDDFWRMVWQQNVNKIVMLARLMELNKEICHLYWPDGDEVKQYGRITVQRTHNTIRVDYTIRTFNVKHTDSPARQVTQYHFTSWPDQYVPDTSALVRFWRLVKHEDTQTDTGLTVIHCSDGIGRTGTFIGLDSLYTEAEIEGKVNVFMCVAKMREARVNMVQKEIQYQFIHEVLLEAIKSRGTVYTMLEFEQRYGLGFTFDIQQEEDLQREFQSLESLRRDFKKEQVSEALLPENVDKNRSVDILPANKIRPFLMTPVTGRTNYINAVMLPSVTRPRYFIVTQIPLQNTVINFWRLVYDHDCFIIVCLEDSPDLSSLIPDETVSTTVGPFQIQNVKVDLTRDGFTKTTVEIQCNQQVDSGQRVEMYKFFDLETGRPETETILQFIELLQHSPAVEEQTMLVMCNDGSRHSGVFCSMMNIASRLKLDKQVDVFLTIRQLQSVRPQFVQTFDQYKLCYSIVKEYSRAANVYANL